MSRAFIGAMAGITATSAMTIAMAVMFRRLPARQRYPLPPREVTEGWMRRTGIGDDLGEAARRDAALANHFAFGAAAGALYAGIDRSLPLPPAAKGVAYALGVWGTSYLGGFPAIGIINNAATHPRERNGLMIAAHVVWGVVAGVVTDRLISARDEILVSRAPDGQDDLRDLPHQIREHHHA